MHVLFLLLSIACLAHHDPGVVQMGGDFKVPADPGLPEGKPFTRQVGMGVPLPADWGQVLEIDCTEGFHARVTPDFVFVNRVLTEPPVFGSEPFACTVQTAQAGTRRIEGMLTLTEEE